MYQLTEEQKIDIAKTEGFEDGNYDRYRYLFSDPSLHQQVFDFEDGIELHKNSASCAMPVALLCKAISMARHDQRLSRFEQPPLPHNDLINYEKHPSIKMICDWWNNSMPGCHYKAAFFFMNVRVENNDVYFDGYYETPAARVHQLIEDRESQARVRDYILISFFASTSAVGKNDDVLLVNGSKNSLDMQPSRNPAYHCWWSLRHFPERFPALFEYLKKPSI
jgi:hypothetical protein